MNKLDKIKYRGNFGVTDIAEKTKKNWLKPFGRVNKINNNTIDSLNKMDEWRVQGNRKERKWKRLEDIGENMRVYNVDDSIWRVMKG